MSERSAQGFAGALTTLESDGDVDAFVARMFADDVPRGELEIREHTYLKHVMTELRHWFDDQLARRLRTCRVLY